MINYYYGISLNYLDYYVPFYEWDNLDKIIKLKKVLTIRIDNNTIKDIFNNIIIVDNDFLNILKDNNYMCIFSDIKNTIACKFNNEGKIIKVSSLKLEDDISINELTISYDIYKLKYTIVNKVVINNGNRKENIIKKYLLNIINDAYNEKNYSKLKCIYMELFDKYNDDINYIKSSIENKLNKRITDKEYQVYNLLNNKYNNV